MIGPEEAMPPPGARLRVHALVDNLRSGGAEFLLADFAQVAATTGIELSVAALNPIDAPSPAADRLRRLGFEPQAVPVTSMVNPRELRRVRAHLARLRPDLLHTHLITSDFLGGIAARSLGIPSVTTIHADWFPVAGADRLRTWVSSRARRHCADTVIAVSESARSAYLGEGRDVPTHVTVVRNGIVDRSRPGSGARLRQELGLRDDALVITALSKLRPEKNFEASIDAVALLRDRFPQARLVIVGDGPHEEAVRGYAARLGDAVLLLGHREDAMELLDASDVLVHPSHFDAFPTTLLEAMAARVPVVATGVGGILEIVEPDVTGILIAPPSSAEALAGPLGRLLEDSELRARLGSSGRARYEREFSAESWVRRVRGVYDRVLSAREGRPRRWTSGTPRAGS
ncbi:MAG: glycosyltransferase family 4 protein [bacterium]